MIELVKSVDYVMEVGHSRYGVRNELERCCACVGSSSVSNSVVLYVYILFILKFYHVVFVLQRGGSCKCQATLK